MDDGSSEDDVIIMAISQSSRQMTDDVDVDVNLNIMNFTMQCPGSALRAPPMPMSAEHTHVHVKSRNIRLLSPPPRSFYVMCIQPPSSIMKAAVSNVTSFLI